MAKVRIIRGTVAGGQVRSPGDVVDVEPGEYRLLVDLCQKAVPFEEPVAGLGHRDGAAPAKRGRR